jgi:hypothetical protein
MSFRARASAVVLTAAACLLFAPAAMASSHGPVQVTGKQLKGALLPASDFVAGYVASNEADSGSKLEHGRLLNVPSLSCARFWTLVGATQGFGETAFATDLVDSDGHMASVYEVFDQSVYQFAGTRAAAWFYGQLNARYRSCRSVSESDGIGGTFRLTVRSESRQRVGGHQALRLVEYVSDSKLSEPPLSIDVLWTIDGADLYLIDTTLPSDTSPQPSQASLTLKLIARVGALR